MNKLRKKNVPFVWTSEQQKAFDTLKEKISNPPILKVPDFNKRFVLQTDSSGCGLSAVLCQEYDGTRMPIAYASRTLNDTERKYSAYELECLAIVFGIEKFKVI